MFFSKKKKEMYIVVYKHERDELRTDTIEVIYTDAIGLNNMVVNAPCIEIIKVERI